MSQSIVHPAVIAALLRFSFYRLSLPMKPYTDLYHEPPFGLRGTVSLIVLVALIMSMGVAVFVVAATILEHARI